MRPQTGTPSAETLTGRSGAPADVAHITSHLTLSRHLRMLHEI